MKRLPIDPFLPGMCLVVLAAWSWPEVGSANGPVHAGMLTSIAIAGIFLVQGLTLDGESLRRGFSNLKVHLFIQGCIFVVFPVVAWGLLALLPWGFTQNLKTGILFLAVLPTTISTAVVYTGKAGGNSATAMFNVTLANLLGIALVPLAMVVFQAGLEDGSRLDTAGFFRKILLLLVAPFLAGQILRGAGLRWMDGHKMFSRNLCQFLILFILWAAFSNSFDKGVFFGETGVPLIHLCGFVLLLTVIVRVLVPLGGRSFPKEHRPAVFFCSTEKTLAAGLPMATALFGATNPALGILVLPVLVYHLVQLFVDGVIASRWGGSGN